MSVADRLRDELKKALKSGDKDALSAIRMIRAAIQNREIDKGSLLSDTEIYSILRSLARQGRESLEHFSHGGRDDLAEREERYLSIIQSYLPRQLSEEKINTLVKEVIHDVGAEGPGDMGRVMKEILPKISGQADNRLVSELVRKALAAEK